ncbi:MAG TPA: GWxTD domain-containing protein [Flavobacteriales bacterium]|nr:GWxTD domain-containing protein [Flavobacteriales bacterium]
MRVPIILLPILLTAWPYRPVRAQVDVVVETRTFHTPDGAAQVEVNMAFLAGTAAIKINDRGFNQARVEVITLIEQGGAVKAFGKTEVLGPERLDSIQLDLVHQEFFSLSPGSYDLSIEARDLNSGDTAATRYTAPLAVGALPPGIAISDILFAERIAPSLEGERGKYGYTVVPLLTDYLPKTIGKLSFYAEVYGSETHFGADSSYLIDYAIEDFEKKTVFGPFKRSIRAKGRPVEAVMAEFDIAQLPSGNYVLAVEARDRTGALVARREQFFQRNNPVAFNYDMQSMDKIDLEGKFAGAFTNVDSLAEHIASLRPIADPLERKIIDDRYKDRDIDQMRRFFYSFWGNRSNDPERAWTDYREQVIKVNKLFGCRVLKGYETDRGAVYLKYGAPNTMLDRFNEMDTYPYTIWHYYRAAKYTNKRFVFYQPDLVTNCFQLLHSEVPGEIKNNNWNQMLHSRNVPNNGVLNNPVNTMGGDRANEFYLNPR